MDTHTYIYIYLVKTRWAVQVSAGQLPFSKIDLFMRTQDMFQKTFCITPLPSTTTHMVLRARNCQCHGKCKVMIPQNRILSKTYTRKPVAASFSQCFDRWGPMQNRHVFSLKWHQYKTRSWTDGKGGNPIWTKTPMRGSPQIGWMAFTSSDGNQTSPEPTALLF